MNKFKKIMLGALSVLTLGLFVVTGTKVNAATVNNSFTFDLSQFAKITKNTTGTTSTTATDSTSSDTMTLTLDIPTALTGSDSKWDSSNSCYIVGIKSDGESAEFSLSFTMQGSGDATFTYNTGGGSKYVNLSVDGGTATQIANGGTGTKNIENLSAGDHELTFTGTTSSSSNFKLYSFVVTESYSTSSFKSMDSVTFVSNKAFSVGDTVSKDDLVVMATYDGESSAEISKYTFKVYDSSDNEVTGAFSTAGDGYYVVATSTEDTTKSVTSDTFSVGEQAKFTYDCNEISLTETFVNDTNNHNYTTDDNVITFNTFKRYANTSTYTWDDGVTHNTNGLQGSTLTITLAKAARITFHATQTGGTAGKHDIRYMYFEDEDDNCIVSEMNFTISSSSAATKKAFSVNLPAGTYNSHSTDGGFNFYDIIIDYTDSATLDTANTTLILEHSTGTALSGTGTAARFVGVLKNVDADDITSITLDLTLTKSEADPKNASITITSVYTGLPGYDVEEGTLYFYYVITGLEKTGFEGCTIKGTATIVMGTSKGYSTTTWTNA